jgi:tRNA A-37 threonylcarbamoyl transferase component Bud32
MAMLNGKNIESAAILFAWLWLSQPADLIAQQYPFLPIPGGTRGAQDLAQDVRGRLWITGSDTAVFDGTRFFHLRDFGLPATTTYQFSEDSSGAIWLASDTGVYRFSEGVVERVSGGWAAGIAALSPEMAIATVGEADKGLPTRTKLLRIERERKGWRTWDISDLASPGTLSLDHTGNALFPLPGVGWGEIRLSDAAKWRAGEAIPVARHPAKIPVIAGEMMVRRDRFGCVWLAANNQLFYSCNGEDEWRNASLGTEAVRPNFKEAPDGSIVLHGYNFLAIGRPDKFNSMTTANGLPATSIAFVSSDGTLWIANNDALFRSPSPFRLEFWTPQQGAEVPWSFARMGNRIYAALGRRVGILSEDRQRWQALSGELSRGAVSSILAIKGRKILATLQNEGSALLDANGKVLATTKIRSGGDFRLETEPDGTLWIGSHTLGRVTLSGSHLEVKEHPMQDPQARGVQDIKFEPVTRKLWSCYGGGLVVRDEQQHWREFTTRDGLLINPCWSIAPLPNGDVWYGYFTLGAFALIRPDGRGGITVRQYRAGAEIQDPEVYAFQVDQRGWLWRGGTNGISIADPQNAEAGRWLYLDASDGPPAAGVNTHALFSDTDGSLWWGADNVICHYRPPPDLLKAAYSPEVAVSSYSWGDTAPKLAETVREFPNGPSIAVHLGTLQFERRNSLRLRYRVVPDQTSWKETKSLDLALTGLGWGRHVLEVQAHIFGGPWSKTSVTLLYVLRPGWLATPWLVAYACALTGSWVAFLAERRRRREYASLALPDVSHLRNSLAHPELKGILGSVIENRFEVGVLLEEGGFANILSGYDRVGRRACAIKFFREEISAKDAVMRRFKHEVAALEAVRHPHIVGIYAHGILAGGLPYMIMEFIEGNTLRRVLSSGPLPPKRAARLLRQLASALDAIHERDICHRDVKPENLMLRGEDHATEDLVLIDFSIAIVKEADEAMHGLSRAAGTFDYMAPEQAMGHAVPASDIYSLAKVVLEMITGQRVRALYPDAGLDLPLRVTAGAAEFPVSFSTHSIQLLASALEFDPGNRPGRATVFAAPIADDLEKAGGH